MPVDVCTLWLWNWQRCRNEKYQRKNISSVSVLTFIFPPLWTQSARTFHIWLQSEWKCAAELKWIKKKKWRPLLISCGDNFWKGSKFLRNNNVHSVPLTKTIFTRDSWNTRFSPSHFIMPPTEKHSVAWKIYILANTLLCTNLSKLILGRLWEKTELIFQTEQKYPTVLTGTCPARPGKQSSE